MTTVAQLFFAAVAKEIRATAIAFGLVLVSIMCSLALPWPLKILVDNVLSDGSFPPLLAWVGTLPGGLLGTTTCLAAFFLLFHIGLECVNLARSYVVTRIGIRMRTDLGVRILDQLQRLDLVFHGRGRVGDMTSRVTQDAQFTSEMLGGVLLPGLLAVGTLISMLAVLSSLSPELAIAAVVVSIPVPFFANYFRPRITDRSYRQQQLMGDLAAATEQSISTIQIVQAFNREDHTENSFRSQSNQVVDAVLAAKRTELAFSMSMGLLQALGTGGALVLGGFLALRGEVTVGTLLVAMSYLRSTFGPIGMLADISAAYGRAVGKGRRVIEILNEDVSIVDREGAHALPMVAPGQGRSLTLEAVSFGYPGQPSVLREADLVIQAGEIVALIGPTGVGKSTLASLLIRLADPSSGRILIDGHDLRDVSLGDLRKNMGVVLQDPYLMPLSVAENIRLAKPGASMDEIESAARAAQAHTFVRDLPDGYETVLSERGSTLSGGQRQRISLARAFLKDAPVLILDEPSSALDVETEAALFGAIAAGRRDRTVIMIAHRPATLRYADRVVELRDGKLREKSAEDIRERGEA